MYHNGFGTYLDLYGNFNTGFINSFERSRSVCGSTLILSYLVIDAGVNLNEQSRVQQAGYLRFKGGITIHILGALAYRQTDRLLYSGGGCVPRALLQYYLPEKIRPKRRGWDGDVSDNFSKLSWLVSLTEDACVPIVRMIISAEVLHTYSLSMVVDVQGARNCNRQCLHRRDCILPPTGSTMLP